MKKTIYGNKIRIIQLASRQQFCINPAVRALNSNAVINERCLELKKGKSKSNCCQSTQTDQDGRAMKKSRIASKAAEGSKSCPFYTQAAIEEVANAAIYNTESIMDIEDLIDVAKVEKGCPYYAARAAAKDAQVSQYEKWHYTMYIAFKYLIPLIFIETGHYVAISNAFASKNARTIGHQYQRQCHYH